MDRMRSLLISALQPCENMVDSFNCNIYPLFSDILVHTGRGHFHRVTDYGQLSCIYLHGCQGYWAKYQYVSNLFATQIKEGGRTMMKIAQKFLFMVVFLGVIVLLIPSYSVAFSPIKLGVETEVTFYGFLRNNTGMFLQNPQPFSQSSNDLATERTWFRGYTDFKITKELRFWSAIQFAYEPYYRVERGATSSSVPVQMAEVVEHNAKEYSEYRNINDILREAYLEWKPSKAHDIRVGRQIVIWGEALTTRVGDVIHPDDQRFTLAFANLEDTRIPSWMVRGMHEIPALLSSFEWIYNPNLVQNKYTVNRSGNFAVPLAGLAGQRFAINPEMRFNPPFSVGNVALFGDPKIVQFPPLSRDWIEAFPGFWVPTALPSLREEYPKGWGKYARGGVRTNTTFKGFNFGFSYFHTQNYDPVIKRGDLNGMVDPATSLPYRDYILSHPNIDIIGATVNKQLPWPGVLRAEVIYVPNKPFNTFDLRDNDAIVRRDYIKYMIAYDLNSFFYFNWHKTAPFDITFEHVGEVIPKNENIQYAIYGTEQKQWNPSFNMRISTNWLYNLISTELVASYMPWGRSGLIMPAVKYTPAWRNEAVSFELKYINIFGKNNFQGLGILRSKDMVVLTAQYNF